MIKLSDLDVAGKRVFLRADLDVPLGSLNAEPAGTKVLAGRRLTTNAEQATRLRNLKPTVEYLLSKQVKQVFIAGHIDRPTPSLQNGNPVIDPALSTQQLLGPLEEILGTKIVFKPGLSILHEPGLYQVDKPGSENSENVFLLENLRFWPGETVNNLEFVKLLAGLADIYVNEAFANCHRAHASMVGLPMLLPHAAGLHLEKEIFELNHLLENPARPFVAIVGGAKIETKVPVIENLAKVADYVLVGGKIAKQLTVNGSQSTDNANTKPGLELPYKPGLDESSNVIVATLTADGKDISDESISKFREIIGKAKTVVWNGPMGVFEEGFLKGSQAVAEAILKSGAYSVVGGGETIEFLAQNNLLAAGAGGFSFVSSGGGAMLVFLAGKELPGIKALE